MKKGQTIAGYTFKYGVPDQVIDIYGDLIQFRTPEFLDGIGTFDAKEDKQELLFLLKTGAIEKANNILNK